jgi:hypothetical protein
MFSKVRNGITYANVTVTVALVFAMSGGAYAAKHYLITSTTQISPKVLKQLKGKNGTNGINGVNGKDGAPGEKGAPGTNGANGKDGKDGINGVSVTSATLKAGDKNCPEGGSELKAASGTTYACNGSPWTAGGTLPKGKTETGSWTAEPAPGKEGTFQISFPIPLAASLPETQTHFAPNSECPGTAEKPTAEPGSLCIYTTLNIGVEVGGNGSIANPGVGGAGAGPTGAIILAKGEASASSTLAFGTWAVTAE